MTAVAINTMKGPDDVEVQIFAFCGSARFGLSDRFGRLCAQGTSSRCNSPHARGGCCGQGKQALHTGASCNGSFASRQSRAGGSPKHSYPEGHNASQGGNQVWRQASKLSNYNREPRASGTRESASVIVNQDKTLLCGGFYRLLDQTSKPGPRLKTMTNAGAAGSFGPMGFDYRSGRPSGRATKSMVFVSSPPRIIRKR
jgi:hypothetical protein